MTRGRIAFSLLLLAAAVAALAPAPALAAGSPAASANVPWYLSRATGLVAYLLLFLTVILGLSIRTKALDRLVARWRITDIHTFLSILTLLFVALHGAALLGDTFVGFSVGQILIPFTAAYRPFWIGVGVLAGYLLLALGLSFPARRLTGYRVWRLLHYLTFVAYIAALAHSIFSGTDSRVGWIQALYEASALLVFALAVYRIVIWSRREVAALMAGAAAGQAGGKRRTAPRPRKAAAPPPLPHEVVNARREAIEVRALVLGSAAAGIAVVLFLAAGAGPFRWGQGSSGGAAVAARAATATTNASPSGQPQTTVRSNAVEFVDRYTGIIQQQGSSARFQIVGTGQQPVRLTVQLQLAADSEGARQVTATSLSLTDPAGATLCSGKLTALDEGGFGGICQGAGPYAGQTLQLLGSIDGGNGDQFAGTLRVTVVAGGGGAP